MRVERLLRRFQDPTPSGERLRSLRAVTALERTGGAEARHALETLAGGAPQAGLTRKAKAALSRLDRRAVSAPR
jgi:hypothetical protein